ncbi:hypothetical protein [Actinomycetospora flava]|uniref:Uncharacterized protein n=1 Tax=Actinomycetospora flava TaxID=3129232 RepID=A0ABU8M472_9PSEU
MLFIAVVAIAYPFRRRIGGAGGGAEKAVVGVTWFLVAIFLGILIASTA